ncbi:MAG: TRAP transporter small permease, partial [Desulfovibrio sp.]|nr:TRAP transporter small permease [Desulfovibrio sp.]
ITTNLFVWIVLLGTACAFRDNANLCVSLFYNKLPHQFRAICLLDSMLISTVFFAFLCYTGCLEVCDEIELERVSDSLELPYYLYSAAVPLFSLLVIFRIWQRGLRDLFTKTF